MDEEEILKLLMDEILNNTHELALVFPGTSGTGKNFKETWESVTSVLHMIEPLGYLEFNYFSGTF